MKNETIFTKIIRREIPAEIIYQDDLVTAFNDIYPKAPIHILIVTNIFIRTVNDIKCKHEKILGRMFTVIAKIAKQKNIKKDGYRIIINCNKNAGQEINHLHMHLLAGKKLGPLLCKDKL